MELYGLVVSGRKRRTYRLTHSGQQTLAAERVEWREFTTVIGGVLGA